MSRNKTVLFISNSQEQFSVAASLFQNRGYNVLFERDVNRSLTIAKTDPPGLIISELAVPDIDGLELCYRVRDDNKLGRTPILLIGDLTNQSSIVADGFRCGATDYLQKPIDQHWLFGYCHEMVGRELPDASMSLDENLLKSLSEKTSDVITIIDPDDGTIHFQGIATEKLLGYESEELLGMRLFDLVHPADVNEVIEYFDSVHWDEGKTSSVDYRIRQKDGSWKLIESTGKPFKDPKIGAAVVVTSREKPDQDFTLETALQNGVLRASMFDNAKIGLALFSPSGHFVESNPALLQLLDYSANELRDMALSEFIFPYDSENDRRALEQVLSGKRPNHRFENGYLTPTGERVWGRLTIVSIPGNCDESHFLIGIFEDPAYRVHKLPGLSEKLPEYLVPNGQNTILDFNGWKIDKGLICKN